MHKSIMRVRKCCSVTGSAIALTGAVRMLVLPHAVTAGALLYIKQEYLITGKPEWARSDLISIWLFHLRFMS